MLAGFCAAGLFETELHVALVGLLLMPFSMFLFVSVRSVAVPQCEFRGPFEVKAVGKEKGEGTPTSCFWGVFRIQALVAALSRAIFCMEMSLLVRVAVCCAAEALSMLISPVGVLLIPVGHDILVKFIVDHDISYQAPEEAESISL